MEAAMFRNGPGDFEVASFNSEGAVKLFYRLCKMGVFGRRMVPEDSVFNNLYTMPEDPSSPLVPEANDDAELDPVEDPPATEDDHAMDLDEQVEE